MGYQVLGVESSKQTADLANKQQIQTLHAFFNEETADQIGKKFDVINAAGVFFHLEELHSVTSGIKKALKEKGVFVVQFMYMKNIIERGSFDQIYHEHLLYYTLKTLQVLLNRHGLSLFDAYLSPIHGGSMMGFVTHTERKLPKTDRLKKLEQIEQESKSNDLSTYLKLQKSTEALKEKTLSDLIRYKEANKSLFGFGAPVKGNTLLNYFGIGRSLLDVMVEKNPLRRGLYTPGTHIPIVLEEEVDKPPGVYFVLAWNFKDEILKNNQALIEKGTQFYFPL